MADGIAEPNTQAALQKDDISERREAPEKPGWLVLAEGELGVREGAGNNPRVVKFFATAGFSGIKQDSFAWCAAAVAAMLKRAGHKPSGSLAARSYEKLGRRTEEAGARRHCHGEARQQLDLDDHASEATVLVPAQEQVGAGTVDADELRRMDEMTRR
ncbi:hypothetical protein MEX01_46290 [Methylorubrum extorquens]|uniref:hypothetical protein n=1 Tax=Methylorubrum extorquens TaxID=408 RepID=UPI00116958BD|nr:hypothetical protein MEX01_46290 [Methylorubrum extorquens]